MRANLCGIDDKGQNSETTKISLSIQTWVVMDIFLEERTLELGLEQGKIILT